MCLMTAHCTLVWIHCPSTNGILMILPFGVNYLPIRSISVECHSCLQVCLVALLSWPFQSESIFFCRRAGRDLRGAKSWWHHRKTKGSKIFDRSFQAVPWAPWSSHLQLGKILNGCRYGITYQKTIGWITMKFLYRFSWSPEDEAFSCR